MKRDAAKGKEKGKVTWSGFRPFLRNYNLLKTGIKRLLRQDSNLQPSG
jgi:hypothetical protein